MTITQLLGATTGRAKALAERTPIVGAALTRVDATLSPGPSLGELAANYAAQGRIDTDAPVIGHAELDVSAPPSVVWSVLSDIAGWTAWSKGVHHVSPPAEFTVGTGFFWWNSISPIQSRLAVITPERELSWTGYSFGARGAHRNTMRPITTGTRIMSEESLNGPLVAQLFPSTKLQAGLELWLREIATESERRAA